MKQIIKEKGIFQKKEERGIYIFIYGLYFFCFCSPIQFLTSGGGSKAWRGYYNWAKPEDMKFFYDGQGFMSVKVTRTEMRVVFYDVYGNILHKWGASKMLYTDFDFPL